MPNTQILTELFRAIAAKNIQGATSIATQICVSEEEKGHRTAARMLRGALGRSAFQKEHPATLQDESHSNGNGFLNVALVKLLSEVSLNDIVLTPTVKKELFSLIHEWNNREILTKHSLSPRSKILFHGPPGCGKSITARAISHELGLPTYLVRFDSVIGAYLGQTAIHLRQIFHFAESTPCVLLLDELDALGKQRGNPLDVGELDRIVIALMQELEHSEPLGLIIATSNLAKNLDDALWRRFDIALHFKAPTKTLLQKYCQQLASQYKIRLSRMQFAKAIKSHSFAEAESFIIAEARRQALNG